MEERQFSLRAAALEDETFLRALFADVHRPELMLAPLLSETVDMLLDMQFRAQATAYGAQFPGMEDSIIMAGPEPAGRLTLAEETDHVRIVDICLLAGKRGRGLGSAVLRKVIARAAAANRNVRLSVRASSPARRLYERLGFAPLSDSPRAIDIEMEWPRPVSAAGHGH